ncbi:phosphatase PAP2 family protein [Paenibacillus sp. D2_2]|uniref:phosphatase PAP2 family protein n=1 Tax=Paenibacillus sp. D2_2 TaxID=3073092 RepID=UPI0028153EFD|nr:phosphatase PAP2 family protein [Paenibacillus sp. D2_2]WMT38972.1 phosphatase PAP2 family protein [Paenibacillus sp. D2_2]
MEYRPLLWILLIPLLNICYMVLNHEGPRVYNLMTDIDAQIPFVPAFIVPYLSWYPFIIIMLIVILANSRETYYRTLIALCLGLITSYFIYYFYQTTVSRPLITGEGILYSLVRFTYITDNPFNCFPSIHVLTTYLVWRGALERNGINIVMRFFTSFMFVAIVLSTLFVKQHYLLDIAAAILIAEVLYFIIGKCLAVRLKSGKMISNELNP